MTDAVTHSKAFCQGKPPTATVAGERWTCPDCGREWELRLIWMTLRTPEEQAAHERWAANPWAAALTVAQKRRRRTNVKGNSK